jgi:mannosyltransferase
MTRTNPFIARVWLHWPILLILVLAAVLRVRGIGHDSLWGDEALTILLAKMSIPELIKNLIWFEQIPPVHHLTVHFWMMIFGDREAAVRMPSAIAGVAAVYVGYVLVRRLVGRRVALITALLMATSPMLIAFSQECRAYSMSVLFGLWSCDLFIRLMRRPTQRLHVAYVLVTTLLIYTHVYGMFTILAQQLIYWWLVLQWWRRGTPLRLRPKEMIRDGIAVLALYSPWIPVVRTWTKAIHAGFWVKKVTFDDVSRAYWTYSGSTAALVAMTALVVIGVWSWMKRPHPRRKRIGFAMLLALMFVPVLVPVTISVLTRPSFAPRYAIMSTIGMLAIAAIGIAAIRPTPIRWLVLAAVAILSPFGEAAAIPRAPWREVGEFLQQNLRSGDLVVIHLRAGTRLYDYYVHRPDVRRVGMDTVGLPVAFPYEPRRVWLVVYDAFPWYTANQIIKRHPVKIGRRKFTWGVMALELLEDPERVNEIPPIDPTTETMPTPPATRAATQPATTTSTTTTAAPG